MDVGECSKVLVSVELDEKGRDRLLHFVIVLQNSVDSFRDVVHNYI